MTQMATAAAARAPAPHTALDDVVESVLGASRALVGVAARSIAAVDRDVTLPQFRTLVALAEHGPQNVGRLAEEVDVHASTATRMCDRLVRRGLIERTASPDSRREVIVRLPPAGRRLVGKVMTARRRAIRDIVARVPEPLRASMVGALQAFADAAGDVPEQAWTAG